MANWISDPQWNAQGRPYVEALLDGPGMRKGEIRYISPAEVQAGNAYGDDPRLAAWAGQTGGAPGQSLLRNRGRWNPRTGQWDQDVNWSNIANIGVGALIAAPLIAGAAGGSAAPGAATAPTTGTGALGGTSAAIPTTAQAALPATTSAAIPAASQAALPVADFTSGVVATLPSTVPAWAPAAVAGAGGATVASLVNQRASATVDPSTPGARPPAGADRPPIAQTLDLPFGLTGKDLAGFGLNFYNNWANRNAQGEQTEARAAADKAALDFAMRAYDEQKTLEQARFEATEARRVPYRAASLRTLEEFRRLLGIEN